ncbi:short-chain dehydrogenase TIC 32, chloroplastic-like [Camellia sinensis]|uniref:short-chain dehydrogenase TIC 32, chloroplastic-like n=1 Tax=Camellia sinensis TaxID=4442 RepID=UPI001035D965|nr:short-chain dehydrogenase TIC 32, chloroplastic-like [Camellia sinensis]
MDQDNNGDGISCHEIITINASNKGTMIIERKRGRERERNAGERDTHSYNGTDAYAQSKLANILHTKEIARQLKARNARVTMNAVHPGIVKTGIIRDHKGFVTDSVFFLTSKLLKTTPQGASTTCYVALSQQTEGVSGKYFADCNESNCSALANDESQAHMLWKQTRALIRTRLRQPVT